jgi:hypothetical protein
VFLVVTGISLLIKDKAAMAEKMKRGFPHLNQINDYILHLFKSIPSNEIINIIKNPINLEAWNSFVDPVIGVQKIAKAIAGNYKLSTGVILVTFNPDLNTTGKVELSHSKDFFIELHSMHKNNPDRIIAVLAHEVTHIFLYKHGITMPSKRENELFTDTAAAFLGLGEYILNCFIQEKIEGYSETTIRQEHLGYLTPDEFGYILAKRNWAFGNDSFKSLRSSAARSALCSGMKLFSRQLLIPPLSKKNIIKRIIYRINRTQAMKKLSSGKELNKTYAGYEFEFNEKLLVKFKCPLCSQMARIPVTKEKVQISCPICNVRFYCYS